MNKWFSKKNTVNNTSESNRLKPPTVPRHSRHTDPSLLLTILKKRSVSSLPGCVPHPYRQTTLKKSTSRTWIKKIKKVLNKPIVKTLLILVCFGVLLGCCLHALADGADVLAGTTNDATATIKNTGKKWLYLVEGITALGAYIKTKNIFVLGGVAVVAIFLNIVLKLAGS